MNSTTNSFLGNSINQNLNYTQRYNHQEFNIITNLYFKPQSTRKKEQIVNYGHIFPIIKRDKRPTINKLVNTAYVCKFNDKSSINTKNAKINLKAKSKDTTRCSPKNIFINYFLRSKSVAKKKHKSHYRITEIISSRKQNYVKS